MQQPDDLLQQYAKQSASFNRLFTNSKSAIATQRQRLRSIKQLVQRGDRDSSIRELIDRLTKVESKKIYYRLYSGKLKRIQPYYQLIVAITRNDRALFDAYKDRPIPENRLYHLLHIAIDRNRLEMFLELLPRIPDVDRPYQPIPEDLQYWEHPPLRDITLLEYSVSYLRLPMVRALLERGADVNQTIHLFGFSLLDRPVIDEMFRILLEYGGRSKTNFDSARQFFATPLIQSIRKNAPEQFQAQLQRQGVDVDRPNQQGMTPLWASLVSNRPDMFRTLLEKGATVSPRERRILSKKGYEEFETIYQRYVENQSLRRRQAPSQSQKNLRRAGKTLPGPPPSLQRLLEESIIRDAIQQYTRSADEHRIPLPIRIEEILNLILKLLQSNQQLGHKYRQDAKKIHTYLQNMN